VEYLAGLIANGLEIVALVVILAGAMFATVRALLEFSSADADQAYRQFRTRFGRAIILSLEFLVAADIIGTVAIDPSFGNIGVLAAIVAVRTFLSFSIELETEGRWPWQASPDVRSDVRHRPHPRSDGPHPDAGDRW
jgi:uncharacterized membrane protein